MMETKVILEKLFTWKSKYLGSPEEVLKMNGFDRDCHVVACVSHVEKVEALVKNETHIFSI